MLGLRRSLLGFGRFRSQCLLLCYRLSFGFFSFIFLTRGFGSCLRGLLCSLLGFCLHAFSFGFGSFRLLSCFLSLGTAFPLRFRVGPSLGLAIFGGFLFSSGFSLGFIFGPLLHGHDAGFLSRLCSFTRSRLYCCLALLLPIRVFRLFELCIGLGQDRIRIFVARRNVRNPERVSCFEQLQRRGAVNSKNRVLDVLIVRRIRSATNQFIFRADFLALCNILGDHALHDDHVAGFAYSRVGLCCHDQTEGL